MKRRTLLFAFILVGFYSSAQYSTPGTGVKWTLDSLVAHAPSIISSAGSTYILTGDLEVSATDTLWLSDFLIWKLDSAVEVDVFGTMITDADTLIKITAVDTAKPYAGFRFEEFSHVSINDASISHGGGLRVLTEDFHMNNSFMLYNVRGVSTGAAVSFSRGKPVVMNSVFKFNDLPAFSSGANQEVAATFKYNYLEGNGQENSNRPQINMGPTGPDTTFIIGNTIAGDRTLDRVGGVSVSSLLGLPCNAVIDSNEIRDNRYGITITGANCFGYIRNNTIEDNNTETQPLNGGSGINLYGGGVSRAVQAVISGNKIRRNLWGVTLVDSAVANLGDTSATHYNEGKNIFAENGNGGVTYALYNNTPHEIKAMNNCWLDDSTATAADVEGVIFHVADDASLGEVIYNPFWDCTEGNVGLPEENFPACTLYPNPAREYLYVQMQEPARLYLYSVSGELVRTQRIAGEGQLHVAGLPAGIYILNAETGKTIYSRKLIVE